MGSSSSTAASPAASATETTTASGCSSSAADYLCDPTLSGEEPQYRWCEGTLSLVTDGVFRTDPRLDRRQRLSYWSGFLYYAATALNALIAPVPLLVMVLWLPQRIAPINMLPLIGIVILWFVILPLVSHATWRADVLRVQTIYGYAHLFCIIDMLSGHVEEWVPSGRVQGTFHVSVRVRRFMVPYLVITQAVSFGGLVHGIWVYGMATYWATAAFAVLGAYILWPVAWLGIREGVITRRRARQARESRVGRHRALRQARPDPALTGVRTRRRVP